MRLACVLRRYGLDVDYRLDVVALYPAWIWAGNVPPFDVEISMSHFFVFASVDVDAFPWQCDPKGVAVVHCVLPGVVLVRVVRDRLISRRMCARSWSFS